MAKPIITFGKAEIITVNSKLVTAGAEGFPVANLRTTEVRAKPPPYRSYAKRIS